MLWITESALLYVILGLMQVLNYQPGISGMSRQLERLGKLNFWRSDLIGKGRYGSVVKGRCEKCMVDVAVKHLDKYDSQVESDILWKASGHLNVIHYFCLKDNDVEFM